ncbi:hypothetical protein TUM17576_17190 [Enterobacter hormaechei]|nr:hypothetical protein TUM17576_17190 [Enterobacter hormaechei]
MANPFRIEITDDKRIELTDTALGSRPVYIHTHAQFLSVACRRKRRISSKRRRARQKQSHR